MSRIYLKNALKKALKHTIYTRSYNVYLEDNHFIAKSYDYGYYNDMNSNYDGDYLSSLNDLDADNDINSIYFDNDFLVIVLFNKPSITKCIFDLRDVELPNEIINKINSFNENISNKNDSNISKYIPYIFNSINMKNCSLINKEEIDDIMNYYNNLYKTYSDRDIVTLVKGITIYRPILFLFFVGPLITTFFCFYCLSLFNTIKDDGLTKDFILFVKIHFSLFLPIKLYDSLINSYQFDDYVDLCRKVQEGDTILIEELTETLATEFYKRDIADYGVNSSQIDNEDNTSLKSSFELGLFRDLTILNSIDSQANATKILNLLNLGYEYLMYQSNNTDNDSIVEDLFRKRLNDIEKTIVFPLEIDNILSKPDADLIKANTIDVGNQKILTPILHR